MVEECSLWDPTYIVFNSIIKESRLDIQKMIKLPLARFKGDTISPPSSLWYTIK
jgi:hypothetical protein